MTYDLILGDRAYSSWSLRIWLLFDKFDLPRNTTFVDFKKGSVPAQMPGWAPAKTVPAIRTTEGAIVGETIAIAEELATRHPDLPLWPANPKARATARALASEMHSGFGHLRNDCPMNLRLAYSGVTPSESLMADLNRIELIWDHARTTCQSDGPWLCGDYGVVDAFYAPIAARIAGYGLPISKSARAYVNAHLNETSFRQWRAMGLVHGDTLNRYAQTYDTVPWPGPEPLATKPVDSGPSVNKFCPYSGDIVTHFLEMDDRIFGFCNAFCRDKTVADPKAWPKFMALL